MAMFLKETQNEHWLISKKSPSLKPLGQMNRNFKFRFIWPSSFREEDF
jgi:hypothetical protein